MDATSVTLRVSRTDHRAQTVSGQFVELRDRSPVRIRPWHLRYCPPAELDAMAADSFDLVERVADWSGAGFDETSNTHVSVYRSRPPRR